MVNHLQVSDCFLRDKILNSSTIANNISNDSCSIIETNETSITSLITNINVIQLHICLLLAIFYHLIAIHVININEQLIFLNYCELTQ